MLILLGVLALGVSTAALSVAVGALRASRRVQRGSLSPEGLEAMHAHLEDLTNQVGTIAAEHAQITEWRSDLTLAVDEGIRHVDRAENRVRAVIRRAREKLEEHGIEYGAIEAEAAEIRERDAGGGGTRGVLPMPASVGSDRQAPPGVPGYFSPDHIQALKRATGG